MHIAHFIQRYPPALGGSEAYFARLGDYLADAGDAVTVWTSTAVQLDEFWRASSPGRTDVPPVGSTPDRRDAGPTSSRGRGSLAVRRFRPRVFPGRRYVLKALSLIPVRPWQCLTMPCNPFSPGMWRAVGGYDGPVDVVHATAFPYAFPILCGLRLARERGVPFFLTPFLHLGDTADPTDPTRRQYTSPQLRWLLRQADRVFVQTSAEWDAVVAAGVPADRVVLQGLGVDPSECTGGERDAARTGWRVGSDEVVVGHLANASVEKGTVDLLRAAERLWAAGQSFRVVLAGPEMANFRTFWNRFPYRDRVVRLGVLTDRQKRDFYAGIDVFALPSRSDSFGLVLLEAWANGKPNLVYQAGGPAEIVRHDRDGLQAACGSVDDLAGQLDQLCASRTLRERLGRSGNARIAGEFRWGDKLAVVRSAMREFVEPFATRVAPPGAFRAAHQAGAPRPGRCPGLNAHTPLG